MIIEYTGSKSMKTVEYNRVTSVFLPAADGEAPTAEVVDRNVLQFLLNADMKGLFRIHVPKVPKEPEAPEKEPEPKEEGSETAEEKKKKAAAKKKADAAAKKEKDNQSAGK